MICDANGNTPNDYKKADEECPIGYIVVWNRWEKGFKYRKLDKDGYVEPLKPRKKMKFVVKNIDWVWCCGNKIPKDMEKVGCSYCF